MLRLLIVPGLLCLACGGDPQLEPLPIDAGLECTEDPLVGPAPMVDAGAPMEAGVVMDATVMGMDAGTAPAPTGDLGPCPAGQTCRRGRCYVACTPGMGQCAQGERCGASGICEAGMAPDTGTPPVMDAGPVDPCMSVVCDVPEMPACIEGECYQCAENNMGQCGIATGPICNIARGSCFAPAAAGVACDPCNTDADCDGLLCRVHNVDGIGGQERTCLPACADNMCPQGFICDMTVNYCVPVLNSCTLIRNAQRNAPCEMDADCVPIGGSVPAGACNGAMPGMPGICRAACGVNEDCPDGYACDGAFCVLS